MAGLTRGPLAAEVYWRRRLLFLAVAFLLVLGLARVLGDGSDASDAAGGGDPGSTGTAAQAGAAASVTPTAPTAPGDAAATGEPAVPTPTTAKQVRQAKKAQRAAKKAAAAAAQAAASAAASAAAVAALPDPQGTCSDTDVTVTPSVPSPVGGGDVTIDLQLGTYFSPACTWKVSPDTLAVKITSGPDDIWSSQQCPKAVPTQDVVLRRAAPTTIQVVWNGKRSDETCSPRTDWAVPDAFYHVLAAALAGEPSDVQFELLAPSPATIVTTAAVPDQAGTKAGKKKNKKNQ